MKRKPVQEPVEQDSEFLKITPLGAGNEVGRSCILLQYKSKSILLDCGLHPAYSGLSALPFLDHVDLSTIDLVLITHFHVDHAAGLPYLLEKTRFKGQVYMTHPTKAIYKWLLTDYVKITSLNPEDQLYTEQDLQNSFMKIKTLDYHQQVQHQGIKFTAFNAGHVLGAAMFLIEIAGVSVFYTGDYSREEDRHLMAAETPNCQPQVLICESTYGVQSHEPRVDRETRFTRMVHSVVGRGGRCLLPVFALGRAQELLLILDEYWQTHSELHSIPIYYCSSLAKKCMSVYQTYTNMMNHRIREIAKTTNPFQFKHISNLKSIQQFDDIGPCVMFASPGMLQSGLSRELLELWCTDKKNGVIVPGYVVEGTLGKQILSLPEEIPLMNGGKAPLRLSVEYISFSAHVDYKENSEFIDQVGAKHLVLVHGDANEMGRLKSALTARYADRELQMDIHTPKNCDTVELLFRGEKIAKVVGGLASQVPCEGDMVNGILTSKEFTFQIVSMEELEEFTELKTVPIYQHQSIKTTASKGLLKWHLEQLYGPFSSKIFQVGVNIQDGRVDLEWTSSPMNDMIADSVVACVLQADSSPASVKGHHGHSHEHEHDHKHEDSKEEKKEFVHPQSVKKIDLGSAIDRFLTLQFGNDRVSRITKAETETTQPSITFQVRGDKEKVVVHVVEDGTVWDVEGSGDLKRRVEVLVGRVVKTWLPLDQTYV